MKKHHAEAHMKAAFVYANLSHCERKRVGCIIVNGDTPLSNGWNGTPPGFDNCCETPDNVTKPQVRHAEFNAILKLTRSPSSGQGASVFVTVSPCFQCSELLIAMEVGEVFYSELYRSADGIDNLTKHGIPVHHMPMHDTKQQ
jgi:dCMP deaminase